MRGVETRKSFVQPVKALLRVEGSLKSAWRMGMFWARRESKRGDEGEEDVWCGVLGGGFFLLLRGGATYADDELAGGDEVVL
jgi:hypothetical protein